MNKIINKFSWTRDKFMPELHFKPPGIISSRFTLGFTKHRERIRKLEEQVV